MSPICERFSFHGEKDILDAHCFAIAEPKHSIIANEILDRYKRQSAMLLRKIERTLRAVLKSQSFEHTLQSRFKNPWSIWRKLNGRAAGNPLKLKDIFAFRIILASNDPHDCYEVLHLLHDRFHPLPGSFKDYISIPKINGYQSIHTVLFGILPNIDFPVEIQIRTQSMHAFAEHGMVSHWWYSRGKRTVIVSEEERKLHQRVAEILTESKARNQIHCLTPKGDLYALPSRSSIIDFAYRIHTDIGNRFLRARVNGKVRDAQYALQEGDRIEIMTGSKECVTKDWLQIAVTPYARRRIYERTRS